MKKKFLLPILSVCMVVALVSVGFAAWLITGNDTSSTTGGSFVTQNVSNEFFTATIDHHSTDANGQIVFGKPNSTVSNAWFTFDNDVGNEKLTAKFTITITPEAASALNTILDKYSITVTLKAKGLGSDATTNAGIFDTLAGTDKKYVAYPTLGSANIETGKTLKDNGISLTIPGSSFTSGTNSATYDLTVTFAWGDYFKKDGTVLNPYTYFNGLEGGNSQANRQSATTVMNAIHELNNKTGYELTLSAAETPSA